MVPHGSLGKGSGKPTNLAKSFVLVSKVLTNSDTHGRIILPRVAVEANLSFLMGYRCASCRFACGSLACSPAAPRPTQSGQARCDCACMDLHTMPGAARHMHLYC